MAMIVIEMALKFDDDNYLRSVALLLIVKMILAFRRLWWWQRIRRYSGSVPRTGSSCSVRGTPSGGPHSLYSLTRESTMMTIAVMVGLIIK